MYTIAQTKWVSEGSELFNAYFENELKEILVRKFAPFTGQPYDVVAKAFVFEGQTYAVMGYEHYNGHLSNFRDKTTIFKIKLSKLIKM